jgi:hypothetical protein
MTTTNKKYRGPVGTIRAYVYDAVTGEELRSGLAWMGSSEAGIFNGKRYMGTAFSVTVVDLVTREYATITADSFPGRKIAVKVWLGTGDTEWRAMVDRSRGWLGNESKLNAPHVDFDFRRHAPGIMGA